jgi:hypothetical protein
MLYSLDTDSAQNNTPFPEQIQKESYAVLLTAQAMQLTKQSNNL